MILDINKQINEACSQITGGIKDRVKTIFECAVNGNITIIEYGDDFEIDWREVWKEVVSELKLDAKCTKDEVKKC